jgi:uncharacterized protein
MANADVQGKFLWHELVTADPGAAGAFYGKVLGWTPQAWDKDPSYTVLLSPKGPVGGMMKPGADAHAGASAQWLTYVGSTNVEETASAAQRLGGRIVKGAADIPGGGRYAVLADPQGAVFGIHSPPATGSASHAADAFSWHELATSDHAAALRFYRELFGWEQVAVHDMGAMGPYVIFGRGSQQFGGIFSRAGGTGAHWLAYVRVSSASKAADAAKAAGGRVINGPHQVPGGSWIAQLADPQGAAIAVNQMQTAAESAQQPKPAEAAKPAAPPAKPAAAQPPRPAPSAKPAVPAAVASAPARPSAASPPAAGPKPAAPAPSAPAPERKPPAAPPAVSTTRAAPAPSAAPAKPAAPAAPARAAASPAAPAKAARKPAARKAAARKAAARKGAARKKPARKAAARAGSRRKKKTARPARKAAAAKRRSAKKSAAARARRGAGSRTAKRSARARSGGRRAGARKSARGRRSRRR